MSQARVRGAQLRMARAALRMSVRELAAAAEVAPNTVVRIEADQPANASSLGAIQRVLEAAGILFLPDDGDGPGVRLKPTSK